MKWNFSFLVLDLETTDDDDHRIIQIGATALDKTLRIHNHFDHLVCPSNEDGYKDTALRPSRRVEELTGISWGSLASAETISGVLPRFEDTEKWAGNKLKKFRLACWGNYFDVNVLRNEYKRLGRLYPWSGTVIDVKTLALAWLAMSGRRTDSASLEHVADQMGIKPPEGCKYHNAATDAFVTAQILVRVLNDLSTSVCIQDERGHYQRVKVIGA